MITVIANLKGGSGKSTVAFNLAVWLASARRSVLCYDLDPQATLSDVLQVRQEEAYQPALSLRQSIEAWSDDSEILIDVGTSDMAAMNQALTAATRIVVPVAPSQADLWSTQRFLHQISQLKRAHAPQIVAFVNRADTHSAIKESDQTAEALHSLPQLTVLKTRLCQRTAYRRSFSEGLAVFELEPNGKAAQEFELFARQLYPA